MTSFVKKNELKKFLNKSDVVVNLLPSTINTYHIIDKLFLQSMKKKSLLINVGRGSTLNEKDLKIEKYSKARLVIEMQKQRIIKMSPKGFRLTALGKWYVENCL